MANPMEIAALEYSISLLQTRLDELRGEPKPKLGRPPLSTRPKSTEMEPPKRRTMSAAARARIAAAQRRRWAAQQAQTARRVAPAVEAPAPEPVAASHAEVQAEPEPAPAATPAARKKAKTRKVGRGD